MKTYTPPVNSLHENPYSCEDLWWVGEAWNAETLDFMVDAFQRPQGTWEQSEELERFAEVVETNAVSNLPQMVPDGEWVTNYLLRALPSEIREGFQDWTEFPHLSRPVRLYLFFTASSEYSQKIGVAQRSLLLMTAEFTEADIKFLFVDGGALRRGDLKPALRNHSLASSVAFEDLVGMFADQKIQDGGPSSERGREANQFFEFMASNPCTPVKVLRLLAAELEEEFKEAVATHRSRLRVNKSSKNISSVDASRSAIAEAILYNPNWDKPDHGLLVGTTWIKVVSRLEGAGMALPTVRIMPDPPPGMDNNDQMLRLYAYRDPRKAHLRERAKKIAVTGANSTERFSKNHYLAGYGLGYYLRAIQQTREAFGADGADVPDEWMAELAF